MYATAIGRSSHFWSLLAAAAVVLSPGSATAEIIFESGTLGPTGVPFSDLTGGVVPGTNIKDVVFTGVRFKLKQPALVSQIGGHFVSTVPRTFFGAIVALDDASDFPDSEGLSTPDVVGTTTLTFPVPSDEVFGDLEVRLDPGWYALVFGSGLFGTLGNGAAPRNNPDIGDPTYIGFQPGAGWFNLAGLPTMFTNHRFVIKGRIVPEPTTFGIMVVAFLPICFFSSHRSVAMNTKMYRKTS